MTNLLLNPRWEGGLPANADSRNASNHGTGPADWLCCDVPADETCACVQCKGQYAHREHLLLWRNTLACRYAGAPAVSNAHGWDMRVEAEFPFPAQWGIVAGWTTIQNDDPEWRYSPEGYHLMARSVLSHVEGQRWRCDNPRSTCRKWVRCADCPSGRWQIGRGIGWDCVDVRPKELGGLDGWRCVRRVARAGYTDATRPDQNLRPDPHAPLYRGKNNVLLRVSTERGQKGEAFQALRAPVKGTRCVMTATFYPTGEFWQHFELRANAFENLRFEFYNDGCRVAFSPHADLFIATRSLQGQWCRAVIEARRSNENEPWRVIFRFAVQSPGFSWQPLFERRLPSTVAASLVFIGVGSGVERSRNEYGTVYWRRLRVEA